MKQKKRCKYRIAILLVLCIVMADLGLTAEAAGKKVTPSAE